MVEPEKFGHLHLVYHFRVPLNPLYLNPKNHTLYYLNMQEIKDFKKN